MYSWDGLEFLEYLWRRRFMVAAACGSALLIAGTVSALLPLRYTATASVLIEPPGGNDPRATTAISPVYLESLKTYELLASSDTSFAHALDDLHLREKYPNTSIEALKRRILSLNKPTNTSILEISATLDDPRQAQALAQYLAEHTVQLNSQLDARSNQDILQEPQRISAEASVRLAGASKARDEFTKTSTVETVSKEVAGAQEVRTDLERELVRARADLAENLARQQAAKDGRPQESQTDLSQSNLTQGAWTQIEIVAARARIQDLEAQEARLLERINEKDQTLEALWHTRDSLDSELKSARAGAEAAQGKLADVQASAPFRGVRLTVLDPGIVPQRASFPNTPLNLVVALLFSLAASVTFLAARFAYARIRRTQADPVYSLR